MANCNKPIFIVEKITGIKFEVTINNSPGIIVIYHDNYDLFYSAYSTEKISDEMLLDAKLEYDSRKTYLTMRINDITLEFDIEYQSQIPGVRYNYNMKQHQQCYNNPSSADIADEFIIMLRNEQRNRVQYCINHKKMHNKLTKEHERIRKLEKELAKIKKAIPRLMELLGEQ